MNFVRVLKQIKLIIKIIFLRIIQKIKNCKNQNNSKLKIFIK